MMLEVEKKYLIGSKDINLMKRAFAFTQVGIVQWYFDKSEKTLKSSRIRCLINHDGTEKWICGTKSCIDGNLVLREENESLVDKSEINTEELKKLPFVIKTRAIFEENPNAEVVVDEFIVNPYVKYDVDSLLEIELKNTKQEEFDKCFSDVINFYGIQALEDVSDDFKYTNNAIALRAIREGKTAESDVVKLIELVKDTMRRKFDEK